jgi:hypothetical protein
MSNLILWFSRNAIVPRQAEELRRLFGQDVRVEQFHAFASAEEVANKFRRSGAAELVAVAPLSVVKELVEQGIRPLYADMERVEADAVANRNDLDLTVRDKQNRIKHGYRFRRFRRITAVSITYEDVG